MKSSGPCVGKGDELRWSILGLVAGSLLVAGGCNGKTSPSTEPQAPLKGQTFRVAIAQDSLLREAVRQRLNEWEFRTESKAELVDETGDAEQAHLWIGDGRQIVERQPSPIPDETLDVPQVDYLAYPALYRLKLNQRNDQTIAVPLSTDLVLLWYRKDLFENEAISKEFQEKLGRALTIPATWKEYLETAQFFREHESVKFGCVEPCQGEDAVRTFFVHAAAYAKGRNWSSFAIDSESGQPRLAAPPFVRGLEEYQLALAQSPAAEQKWVTEAETRQVFRSGDAAMMLGRYSPVIAAEVEGDAPKTRVGVASLPGSDSVFDPRSRAWEKVPDLNRCVHFATTGSYVTLTAKPTDRAANLLLRFLVDKQESLYLVYAARHGVLPVRTELLNDPDRFSGYGLSPESTRELFAIVRDSLQSLNWVADLRTPQTPALYVALEEQLKAVTTGAESPEPALQAAQAAWTEIIGGDKDAFLARYRQSLGLPQLK